MCGVMFDIGAVMQQQRCNSHICRLATLLAKANLGDVSLLTPTEPIGYVSLARENEAGGRRSIFSMLTYRTSFCFWL